MLTFIHNKAKLQRRKNCISFNSISYFSLLQNTYPLLFSFDISITVKKQNAKHTFFHKNLLKKKGLI